MKIGTANWGKLDPTNQDSFSDKWYDLERAEERLKELESMDELFTPEQEEEYLNLQEEIEDLKFSLKYD